ncbi:MAG: nodulation protein NfeD [Halioglobus sp.]
MALTKQVLGFLVLLWLSLPQGLAQVPGQGQSWLIDIKGAIGPASADHMVRGLERAQESGAVLVILQIDTPGGLDTAMRSMIQSIVASTIPVISYVSPGGARAASAGTYILYASHIAAMAPGTNLGAATPVQISPSLPKLPSEEAEGKADDSAVAGTAMERKIINDAVAYIRSLAQLRGRNAQWAEEAVRAGVSLSSQDALERDVINLIAESPADLLQKLHGLEVELNGQRQTIVSDNLLIYTYPTDWRSEFLAVITDPNVAYILMLVGIYGLIFEFSNPGLGVPGVVGALCLILALYAFQVLPVSYAGLGLMLLGISLMTAEAFAPSFGIFGFGGIVAFVVGSIILMDTDLPGYQIAMPLILGFAAFSASMLVFALGLLLKARKQELVSGLDHLVGTTAQVESTHNGVVFVRVDGELWQVESDESLAVNDPVTVAAIDGVTLMVKKLKEISDV